MSCLEHSCRDCDWMGFSNRFEDKCPKCGSNDIHTVFDEAPEHDEPEDEEDD